MTAWTGWLFVMLLAAAALAVGCSVDGTWPYLTPTVAPEPPTPLRLASTAHTVALVPTPAPPPAPSPTPLPQPTPALDPTLEPGIAPSATATAMPRRTPVPTLPPLDSPYLIARGKPATGVVALTFDSGGRDGGQTGVVLDTLHRFGYHATFFLTGDWSEANPGLVRRMAAEGHELANHTYDHPRLTQLSDQEILSEVTRTEELLQRLTGAAPRRYVRPPFGVFDQRVLSLLGKRGYDVVYWTLDSGDWRAGLSAQEVAQRVGARANAGDIVVFHSYTARTAQALPLVLEALRARNLKVGTVSQALGRQVWTAPRREPAPSEPTPSPQAGNGSPGSH